MQRTHTLTIAKTLTAPCDGRHDEAGSIVRFPLQIIDRTYPPACQERRAYDVTRGSLATLTA